MYEKTFDSLPQFAKANSSFTLFCETINHSDNIRNYRIVENFTSSTDGKDYSFEILNTLFLEEFVQVASMKLAVYCFDNIEDSDRALGVFIANAFALEALADSMEGGE